MSVVLIVVNTIIQFIFTALSKFERYNYLSQELSSRVWKIFLSGFVTTGLLLLVINVDYGLATNSHVPSGLLFLFDGQYSDLTTEWYLNVGTVIILTMTINIISTPLVALAFETIRSI